MVLKLALSLLVLSVPGIALATPGGEALSEALTFDAELKSAPVHIASIPNVAVHVPAGFDTAGAVHLVVYLHGLRGCLPVLMGRGTSRCEANRSEPQLGWDLGAHHDAAKTQSIFIVPRLHYEKRGGQPGAFGRAGGFRVFLDELLTGPLSTRLKRKLTRADVASITLVAHSAGYETAIAILERGEVSKLVRAVVLLDALYAFHERYARYVLEHVDGGLRLIVINLRGGKPARESSKLERRLVHELGRERVAIATASAIPETVAAHPIVFADGDGPHGRLPQRHMAEVLAGIGLPPLGPR
jgi:hypothetical protein